MATRYCLSCNRVVEAKRVIGAGTIILAICTMGIWLILIPFYSKRCPMCNGTRFGTKPVQNKQTSQLPKTESVNKPDPMDQIKKLKELKESGAITTEEFNEK